MSGGDAALAPGDMCVTIDHAEANWVDRSIGVIGRTVVLLGIEPTYDPSQAKWAPFWRAAGLPEGVSVSWVCLRKIPPAPMAREIPDLMEMVI